MNLNYFTHTAVIAGGDVTFGSDFTVLPNVIWPWTFKGTLTYTDDNTTASNLGDVILEKAAATPITVTLDTHIHFIDITIGDETTLDSGDQDIYCEGDWTNDGTFDHGTTSSHVHFEGTTMITGMDTSNTFYNVTIESSYSATVVKIVNYGSIEPLDCLTKDQQSVPPGSILDIEGHLKIDGVFHVASNSGGPKCP